MAQFFINTERTAVQVEQMQGLERELERCEESIRKIRKDLNSSIVSNRDICREFDASTKQIKTARENMKCMRKALAEILICYERTESKITGYSGDSIERNQAGISILKLGEMYFSEFKEYIGDKAEKYVQNISAGRSWPEAIVGWYDWLAGDVLSDFNSLQSWIENYIEEGSFKKPDLLPQGADDFLDAFGDCGVLVDVAKALEKYAYTGDGWTAYEKIGSLFFKEVVKRGNKWMDKVDNLHYLGVDKQLQSVLVSTIIKMPSKWLDGVKQYDKDGSTDAGTIVYDTVIGSLSEATAAAAKPVYQVATALTYPVIDQLSECLGYDLSKEYERLTGKKGLDAVFTAQKELWVDVVYAGVRENGAQLINGFYDMCSAGWENWKSGMKLIFGR